jgi:hypothetical protein
MMLYYSSDKPEEILKNSALALMKRSAFFDTSRHPRPTIHIMIGQFDFDETVDANLGFVAAYRERIGHLPLVEVLEGHNHISYALAVGLEGDRTGPRLLEIILRGE